MVQNTENKGIVIENEEKTIDNDSFQRLQNIAITLKERETDSKTLQDMIEDEDGLVVRCRLAESLAIKIYEKEVKCKNYESQIKMINTLINNKRRIIMYEVQEKIDKKKNDIVKLEEKTEGLCEQIVINENKRSKFKTESNILNRLCSYRKAYLLHDVMELFKIDIDGGPASMQPTKPKRDCKCVLVDTIRGFHLPHVASIMLSPHNEIETTTAIGLLIQMLNAVSRILGYALRYPVLPNPSAPLIYCPIEDKVAVLSGWKKRSERERFLEGLQWLGKNIAQLRCDCGIPTTPVADKTLSMLADWIRSVTEGKYVSIYDRPIDNITSPASLLVNFAKPVPY
uniref:Uncharacterized protein n=1 Tax=Caenorhabditis japonica TaxID=281687 RepID=A0A8R1HQI7_CAEJA